MNTGTWNSSPWAAVARDGRPSGGAAAVGRTTFAALVRFSREGYPGVWNRFARPMPRPGTTSVTLGAAALMMGA